MAQNKWLGPAPLAKRHPVTAIAPPAFSNIIKPKLRYKTPMSTPQPPTSPAKPRLLSISTAEFVAMIAMLLSLNALAIDIMLPALDDISTALGLVPDVSSANAPLSDNRQQWIIYAYIAGFGAPQLVFGPLADRYGRKNLLLGTLAAYTIVAFASMATTSFSLLLAIRFIHGITAGAVRVIAVSIVRDAYEGRGMARIMSLVMTVFMVVPILAPGIGQLVLYVAPWQWTFGVLGVAGFLAFIWCALRLSETLPESARSPLSFRAAGSAYLTVLKSRVTFGYMLASGVIFGSLFGFIGAAEQIFTDVFKQGDAFVLWFAAVALILSFANFANAKLVERFGMRRLSHIALFGFVGSALCLFALLNLFGESLPLFFPFFAIMFGCFGMIGSNFNALAMEPLGKIAGTASAAYGFFTTTLSAACGFVIGAQFDGTVKPVILGFAALGITALIIVLITEKGKLFQKN